eukprot:508151_1
MIQFSFWYITLSFIASCLVIDCIVVVLFTIRLWNADIHQPIACFVKYISIICFVSCTANIVCDLCHNYWGYLLHNKYELYTKHYHILIGIADIFYYTATLSLYSIIIYRLYTSFSTTTYAMSNCSITFIVILMISSTLEAITYISSELLWKSETIEYEIIGSLSIVYIVIDVTLNVTVVTLFVSKLRLSMIDIDENEDKFTPFIDEIENNYDYNDEYIEYEYSIHNTRKTSISLSVVSLNTGQKKFLSLMTRYTLLSCIAIIFNQFFNSLAIWNTFYYSETPSYMVEIAYIFRSLEDVINVVVVYLNFGFNSNHYYWLCGCCHHNCLNIMKVNTQKGIKRKYTLKTKSLQLDLLQKTKQ